MTGTHDGRDPQRLTCLSRKHLGTPLSSDKSDARDSRARCQSASPVAGLTSRPVGNGCGLRINVDSLSDCSPAPCTLAVFEFHGTPTMVPLAALRRSYAIVALQPMALDHHVLAFNVAGFFAERGNITRVGMGRPEAEKPDHRQRQLLRARRQWPRCRCAAEKRDELAPPKMTEAHFAATGSSTAPHPTQNEASRSGGVVTYFGVRWEDPWNARLCAMAHPRRVDRWRKGQTIRGNRKSPTACNWGAGAVRRAAGSLGK